MLEKSKKKKCIAVILIGLILLIAVCILLWNRKKHKNNYYEITQYGLDNDSQAMFYTIKSPTGQLAVIDGGTKGYAEYVRQVLAKEGNKVDAWILTHAHEDHMGAFVEIMQSSHKIEVSNVYTINIDYAYYASVAQPVDRLDVYDKFLNLGLSNVTYLQEGDSIDFIGLTLEVFNAYSDAHKKGDIQGNLMNESSWVFKLTNKRESILFCSDTGDKSVHQKLISTYGDKLKSDYMQVGHHGAGYSDNFFDVVQASVLFIDAPKSLREWKDYPVYGNLELLKEKGYTVYTYETAPNTIFLH